MTAPTLERTEIQDPNPGTPVIIKMGGGEPGNSECNVTIDSRYLPFVDRTGEKWHEALSVSPGRIKNLTLNENDSQKLCCCKDHPESNVLMTLKVYFKSEDFFEMGEVVDVNNGSIFLQAKSTNVPFTADLRTGGDWITSTAAFTGVPIKAEFSQKQIGAADNELKLEYYFTSASIDLGLDFDTSA